MPRGLLPLFRRGRWCQGARLGVVCNLDPVAKYKLRLASINEQLSRRSLGKDVDVASTKLLDATHGGSSGAAAAAGTWPRGTWEHACSAQRTHGMHALALPWPSQAPALQELGLSLQGTCKAANLQRPSVDTCIH